MTSSEKFDLLLALDKKKSKVKITTARGEVYFCELDNFAEDEDDWAYSFFTPDCPTKYFILECNFIEAIEEEQMIKHGDCLELMKAIPGGFVFYRR